MLYRTTDSKGHPTATVATLILPLSEPPAGGRNLLAYQPAEDSLTRDCASSYELRKGDNAEALAIALGLAQGWAVVVADHEGPESHWAAGVLEGHAVLDGIRAAERFPQSGLNKRTKVGMWGYSGGGLATAWASELHRSYAKKLNIVGAAYGGAPADVEVTLRNLDGGPLSGIALAGAVGVGRAYPEMKLNALWNKAGRAMAKDIGDMCIEDFAAAYPMRTFREFSRVEDPMALGRVRKVMRTISLGHAKPKPPLFIYHAQQDELNPISATDALVEKYCAMGARVSYHRDPASEHISLVATGAPLAATFLADRFDAKPAPTTCS